MIKMPNCFKRKCVHFVGVKQDEGKEETERVVCKAFPDGIPDEIAYDDNDHTEPFKGDHGIQFEEVNNKENPTPGDNNSEGNSNSAEGETGNGSGKQVPRLRLVR